MSLEHRHANVTYSPADLVRLTEVLSEAQALTKPLPSTETAHMKRLAKMGLKSESFAQEALAMARSYRTLLPVGLDLERMAANLRNRDLLHAYFVAAEQIFARIRAALVLHGVDAYADGLVVYRSLRQNGDDTVREAAQQLGRIFKQKGRRKKKQEAEQPLSAAAAPAQQTGAAEATKAMQPAVSSKAGTGNKKGRGGEGADFGGSAAEQGVSAGARPRAKGGATETAQAPLPRKALIAFMYEGNGAAAVVAFGSAEPQGDALLKMEPTWTYGTNLSPLPQGVVRSGADDLLVRRES